MGPIKSCRTADANHPAAEDIEIIKRQKFLIELFEKSSWCPEATPLGAFRRRRKTRVELVQLLSSGAFAGEFFNPSFRLKKRGAFVREKPPRGQTMCTFQKNLPVRDFSAVCTDTIKNRSIKIMFQLSVFVK